MASRFWVGGTASWDNVDGTKWAATSGGGGGSSAPTSADDVFFDAASGVGTVTVASTAVGRNLDCAGFTGTLTWPGTSSLLPTAGGVIRFSAGMTLSGAGWPTIFSASGANSTLTMNGKSFAGMNFASSGTGGVVLADSLNCTGTVTLTSGTLNTNGQTCTWGAFTCTSASTRTLTLGSSSITITTTGVTWNVAAAALTVTANTATVTMTGASPGFFTSSMSYNGMSLALPGTGFITGPSGALLLGNFTKIGAVTRTDSFSFPGNALTCSGTFTLAGNSTTNRLIAQQANPGVLLTITAAAVVLSNVDFQDVAAAGATPFTGTSLGNCGGNSGITFDTPVTQTRTGAGGNWSTAANWTSRVPLPQDDVVVGAGASGTIACDMPRVGKSIDFTGFAGTTQSFGGFNLTIYGSLKLVTGMTFSNSTATTLAGRGAYTLTSSGKTFAGAMGPTAPGGTLTLVDNLVCASTISVVAGTFDTATNNVNVTCNIFQTSGTATKVINSGTGTWTLNSLINVNGNVWLLPSGAGSTVNGRPNITIATASASTRNITGGNFSYGTLTYTVAGSTGPLTIANSNSFSNINFSDVTNARTLTLTNGTTTSITNTFNVNGTPGKLMTVNSSTPGSAATLSKPNGTVSCNYLSLQDSTAQGGASWFAGANSVNVSNNTGWIFANAPAAGQSSKFMPFFNA